MASAEVIQGYSVEINVLTREAAVSAINSIDSAQRLINESMGNIGALTIRFDGIINNLGNYIISLSDSKSRIFDTDYALETMELAKWQIVENAAIALLAQANTSSKVVLTLLDSVKSPL